MPETGTLRRLIASLGWVLSIGLPALLTVVLNLAGGRGSRDYAFLYLGLVAILGVTFGFGPSLVAAIGSFLMVDYFFVPPYHTLTIRDERDVVNLLVLLGAACFVGGLGSVRRRAQIHSDGLARDLGAANLELERLNREQAEAARVALRLAVTEEQVKALKESDRARRDFLANVSHDLRTPISTILTESTSVLDDDHDIKARSRSSLDSVASEARRLNAIVADILDMSRIEGNALDLDLEPIDTHRALRSASDRLTRTSPSRVVSLPPSEPPLLVVADWSRLGQILDNLLSNADQAAPPGTAIQVETPAGPEPAAATILVRDLGPGIPQELGERVFERFVRGQAKGAGTGLGLAIVKGLVEAHGGTVWIDGGSPGTAIAFSLPLAATDPDQAESPSSIGVPAAPSEDDRGHSGEA